MTEKRPLIVLTGPTAVGKTDLSIKLAKAVNGSIISADSMQVYKELNIGSAKITEEEKQGIPHYLIDILEPEEDFNVVLFQKLAKEAIEEIYSQGRIPIITGGTGFYIQAVLNDIDFRTENDESYRSDLQALSEENPSALFERLREIDPESAENIHPNNLKRVIRAIEYYEQTGEKISVHNAREATKVSVYNSAYFVLNLPRDILYERIEKRVDIMVRDGLVNEVRTLFERGLTRDNVSMQGLGYKELLDHFNGLITLEEAIDIIKADTRHFAKRQLTWFRREKEVLWIDKSEYKDEDAILEYMTSLLKERNII